jgi:hypothetical protein
LFFLEEKDVPLKEVLGRIKFYAPELFKVYLFQYSSFFIVGLICVLLAGFFNADLFLTLGSMLMFWPVTFGVVLLYVIQSDVKISGGN